MLVLKVDNVVVTGSGVVVTSRIKIKKTIISIIFASHFELRFSETSSTKVETKPKLDIKVKFVINK